MDRISASRPLARFTRLLTVPTAHPQIWAARSELYRRLLDTRFHGDDQCGHTVETAPNRRANGRARLASQVRLSGPQESVTALRKLRMGTPSMQAGAARDLARRLVRQGWID
jgi:hypothetical protein